MARMHARRKGKASSKKPIAKGSPSWVRHKKEEIEQLIIKFGKEGKSSSQIGAVLRDNYGIPDVKIITKKKISKILSENNLSGRLPEDIQNLIKRAVHVDKHLKTNKKDKVSKRGLHLIEAKIRRLAKYYKSKGVLPENWKYDLKEAERL